MTGDAISYTFASGPGLYQLSVIADAGDFDWDALYLVLNEFGNVSQRTGPWDFNLQDQNRPLVPAYWVALDGRRLGLWFFQRVSLEDMAARRFRGRMAFLAEDGTHTLTLEPYRPMRLRWTAVLLEADPEDTLEPFTVSSHNGPAARQADPAYWDDLRAKLATTHAAYAGPLRDAFAWVNAHKTPAPIHLPFLIARHRLEGDAAALAAALEVVDAAIARPHWGNPREDGYGHDGDMGAAFVLRALAHAYHALGAELGADRRQRLRDKLRLQGDRFMANALLNRDYWGGSVLQDHGWRALFAYADGVLHLLGVLPEAERWAAYAVPRVRRSLDAMPRDGVIPLSNYCQLYLYLDDVTGYRDALLALTGEDIFEQPQFPAIIDYLLRVVRPRDHLMLLESADPLIGGNAFLNAIAAQYGDGRAAALQQAVLTTGERPFYHTTQAYGFHLGALQGLQSYRPAVPPAPLPTPEPLSFFADGGLATYRDPVDDVTLTIRCAPFAGYHAYRRAQGPCDRMGQAPGAGHFTVSLGAAPRLVTPDGGYKLQSALRTCLLVDGRGQYGDIGYPMSIPARRHRGEEILFARWDLAEHAGWIRLNLAPAYPEDDGLLSYTRDLLLYPGAHILCRDTVAAAAPHRWSWLFQGKREIGVALDGRRAIFGGAPTLAISPRGVPALTARIEETPVVWSYASSSGFTAFDHVRYESEEATAFAQVEFMLTWK